MNVKKFKKGKHTYTDWGKGSRRITRVKEVKKMEDEKNKNQLSIKLDDEVATGKYSNLASITHTNDEFTFDFIYMPPGPPGNSQAKVISRIITSPGHAKRLQMALNDNISKYEAKFGKITAAKNPKQKAGFN
jgi:hypothetical protein